MSKQKKIQYDVSVIKNQMDFYLHFSKKLDESALEEGSNLTFSGSVGVDEDIINNIEKILMSKFPLSLDFVAAEKTEEETSVIEEEAIDSEVENKTTEDSKLEDTVVEDNKEKEEGVSVPDNDYYDIPPVEIPTTPSYTSSNKPKSDYKKSEKKSEPTPPKKEKKDDGIKDVQILAITTQVDLNKANYKELVQEAFTESGIETDVIPPIEELTYKQAIEVIKYGNKKFKR